MVLKKRNIGTRTNNLAQQQRLQIVLYNNTFV